MYVYIESERYTDPDTGRTNALYTVGFYKPDGGWAPESDHGTKKKAANRVAFLNGNYDKYELEKEKRPYGKDKVPFSFRIDKSLNDSLREYCGKSGQSMTIVIESALFEYLKERL